MSGQNACCLFDSANQVFAQPETDARAWNLRDRGREIVLLNDYYAPTDADLTNAFTRFATERGGTAIDNALLLPEGDIPISGAVSFTDMNLAIVGKSMGQSRIKAMAAAAAILFEDTGAGNGRSSVKELVLEKFTMLKAIDTTAGNGGTAIEAKWNNTGVNSSVRHLVARDIDIAGDGSSRFWNKGLRLVDASNCYFSNPHIENETTTDKSAAAIEIVRDAASNITSFQIDGGYLGRFAQALLLTHRSATAGAGTIEGIYANKTEFVSVQNVLKDDNTDDLTYAVNGVHIVGTNANASRLGIDIGVLNDLFFGLNYWAFQDYGEPSDPAPLVAAMRSLVGAQVWKVLGNRLLRGSSVTDAAPVFRFPTDANVADIDIDDNSMTGSWTYGITQAGTASSSYSKIRWGDRNFGVGTLSDTGSGYRRKISNLTGSYSNGDAVSFGQTFQNKPAVLIWVRTSAGTSGVTAFPSNITTTGFTMQHNQVSAQNLNWMAFES